MNTEPDVPRRGAPSPATALERDTPEPRVTPVSASSSAFKRLQLFESHTFSAPYFFCFWGFVLFFRRTLTQAGASEAPGVSKASLPGDTS